jgi:signal transduction histidine kinase
VLDSVDAFLAWEGEEGEEWGILLMGPGLSPQDVFRLLWSQRDLPTPWASLLVGEEDGAFHARGLSLGPPQGLEAVAEMAADPVEKGPALELHWVLRVVAKARHDLNNPLTAGLAEVQLLLMEEHSPELTESLEIIQDQFRRLRDMVLEMSRLRVPRKTAGG